MDRLTFSMEPVPPFRLDLNAWAIRRRPENAMDGWDGESYKRVVVVESRPVSLNVTQSGTANDPRIHITLRAARLPSNAKTAAIVAVERLLGVRVNLQTFYHLAAQDRRLHELVLRFRGLKPPRFPSVWEGLVNGIACQQFSLAAGITLLNRLTALAGLALHEDNSPHAFPRAEDLAATKPEAIRSLGFNAFKSRELVALGRRIASGQLGLEPLAELANDEAMSRLLELPGVGRWTAEYVLLRALGRLDIFPGDDIGARNNLARWLRLRKPLDYGRVMQIVDRWKPFAGLIYFHLLLDGLDRGGYLHAEGGRIAGSNSLRGLRKMIKLKRVYEEEAPDDGTRYLVERLWPRGVKKESLHIDGWLKDAGPSTELRKWFSHDPKKWNEFRRRYFSELDKIGNVWAPIREAAERGTVTLLYSSHDAEHNNALALKEYIEGKLGTKTHAGKARHSR